MSVHRDERNVASAARARIPRAQVSATVSRDFVSPARIQKHWPSIIATRSRKEGQYVLASPEPEVSYALYGKIQPLVSAFHPVTTPVWKARDLTMETIVGLEASPENKVVQKDPSGVSAESMTLYRSAENCGDTRLKVSLPKSTWTRYAPCETGTLAQERRGHAQAEAIKRIPFETGASGSSASWSRLSHRLWEVFSTKSFAARFSGFGFTICLSSDGNAEMSERRDN